MRLIEEKVLKEYQMQIPPEWLENHLNIVKGMIEIFTNAIEAQPIIDAEPVVRCKDCKHCQVHKSGNEISVCYCIKRNGKCVHPNGFCNYGAKMDEEVKK